MSVMSTALKSLQKALWKGHNAFDQLGKGYREQRGKGFYMYTLNFQRIKIYFLPSFALPAGIYNCFASIVSKWLIQALASNAPEQDHDRAHRARKLPSFNRALSDSVLPTWLKNILLCFDTNLCIQGLQHVNTPSPGYWSQHTRTVRRQKPGH